MISDKDMVGSYFIVFRLSPYARCKCQSALIRRVRRLALLHSNEVDVKRSFRHTRYTHGENEDYSVLLACRGRENIQYSLWLLGRLYNRHSLKDLLDSSALTEFVME